MPPVTPSSSGSVSGNGAAPPPMAPPPPETQSVTLPSTLDTSRPDAKMQSGQTLPINTMPKESWGRSVYHGVLSALGGANDVSLARDPKTGQMIATSVKAGPGQQWKRIISGALTGYAAAAATGAHGPGSTSAKIGTGFQAAQNQVQQRYAKMRQEANEDFETQQKAAMQNAQTALLTHKLTASVFDLAQRKVQASVADTERENGLSQLIEEGGEGTQDLGVLKNMDEVMQKFKDDPSLHDHMANGRIVAIPHIGADGTIDGVHAALVTLDWMHAKTTRDLPLTVFDYKDGKLTESTMTVPAGAISQGDYVKANQTQSVQALQRSEQDLKQKDLEQKQKDLEQREKDTQAYRDKQLGISQQRVNIEQQRANTERTKATTEGSKAQQEAEWGPGGYVQGFKPWHKEMVEPVQAVENSYQVATDAYNEYKEAAAQGKRLPTGAESMQLLSKHMQTTFGQVKGGRLTQAMIEEHMGARGITDNMVTAVNHLYNGEMLSSAQWDAFYKMIGQTRDAAWKNLISDANAQGRPLNKVNVPADMMRKYGPQQAAPGGAAPAPAPAPAAPGGGAPSPGPGAAPPQLPDAAAQQVKAARGQPVHFANGQTWQLNQAGQIVQVTYGR